MNFDFEGEGSGDQAGLTNLITSVAGSLRAADPHWQITMDTYASSAGDPGGFYNIPALAPVVDAFFVMDYELNLAGTPSAASPLTSGMFSSQTTLAQYTRRCRRPRSSSARPSSASTGRPTTAPWRPAPPAARPTSPTRRPQGNGPEYWDPVTDTAWTSYQVGGQWHESYYEGENGLYDVSQLASHDGARGVGIWALGMESDGAQMIAALDGISPGAPPGTGPQATSSSAPAQAAAPAPAPPRRGRAGGGGGSTAASPAPAATAATTPPRRSRAASATAAAAGVAVGRAGTDDHDHGAVHHRGVQRRDGRPDADRRRARCSAWCRRAR